MLLLPAFIRNLSNIFICLQVVANVIATDRFAIQLGNPYRLCPMKADNAIWTCSNGKKHYLCVNSPVSKHCQNFQLLRLMRKERDLFTNSHNGLRNKFADDFGIANMNLVYWSPELELMALLFLRECHIGMDSCSVIGENAFEVGQTYSYGPRKLMDIWPGYVVRSWYMELGPQIKTWAQFKYRFSTQGDKMLNLSQIFWPPLEFIGCATALMSEAQYVVCFYYPKMDLAQTTKWNTGGRTCSKCVERSRCSIIFEHLCGIDIENKTKQIANFDRYAILSTALAFLMGNFLIN